MKGCEKRVFSGWIAERSGRRILIGIPKERRSGQPGRGKRRPVLSLCGFRKRFIHHLFVSRTFQGQGIGTGLLRKAAEIYGFPLSLKCVCENRRALEFYRSRGWRITERGKSGKEAWYRMELEDEFGNSC